LIDKIRPAVFAVGDNKEKGKGRYTVTSSVGIDLKELGGSAAEIFEILPRD